jgi:hypothetical protein
MNDLMKRYIGKPVSGHHTLVINSQRIDEWVQGKLIAVNDNEGTIVIEQYLTFYQYLNGEKDLPSSLRGFKILDFKFETFRDYIL